MVVVVVSVDVAPHRWVVDSSRVMMMVGMEAVVVTAVVAVPPRPVGNLTALVA